MNRDFGKFRRNVLNNYRMRGRRLPWRETTNPYKILVSEIMLQQTQVNRVVPKYQSFLKKFPTVKRLDQSTLQEVLHAWSGLGYNRRAKMLHSASRVIVREHLGKIPRTLDTLVTLPGVGNYTASAVLAFAFNKPAVLLETNIRSVYLDYFFPNETGVADRDIVPLIEKTLPVENPRLWYWALMDYGAHIKSQRSNPSQRSKHHTKQKPFRNSNRERRGHVLKKLLQGPATQRKLAKEMQNHKGKEMSVTLEELTREGFIKKSGLVYELVSD